MGEVFVKLCIANSYFEVKGGSGLLPQVKCTHDNHSSTNRFCGSTQNPYIFKISFAIIFGAVSVQVKNGDKTCVVSFTHCSQRLQNTFKLDIPPPADPREAVHQMKDSVSCFPRL